MQSTVPRILDYVPVGFGFRPTDEELVDYYLRKKLLDDNPRVHVMPVIDLCDVEPWEVPVMFAESTIRFREPDKFFFSPVDYKYSNSKRFNRTTKCGFWKATGKDLDIRTWDTNTVIGTKKTLVFYKGSVSCGVKSNWVIHEYHAAPATFPESQRTFVLCRLIKKPEKTTEGGTDALICDEGEPSRRMISADPNQATVEEIPSGGTSTGMETIFRANHQAEKYFSPIQQSPSPTGIGQEEASFPNYPFYNAYFKNEKNVMQTPFETTEEQEFLMQAPFETTEEPEFLLQTPFETTTEEREFLMQTPFETTTEELEFLMQTPFETTTKEHEFLMQIPFETTTEEDEFLNSIFADENLVTDQENMHAFVNSSTQSESLKRVYCESSDTDAEVVSKLDGSNTLDISTVCNEYPNSDEYHSSKRFKSSHDAVHGGTCLLSSSNEGNQEKKESIIRDDFWVVETSSCDSATDKPLEFNCIEISCSPSTPRRWENQYHPRPNNFI